jgi:hypothetical protein
MNRIALILQCAPLFFLQLATPAQRPAAIAEDSANPAEQVFKIFRR